MDRLEPRLLDFPAMSLEQTRMVINNMAGKAKESVSSAVSVRREYSKAGLKRVDDLEGVLDRYEDKLGAYLFKITSRDLTEAQSREAGEYLRVLTDFERISDHAKNIGEAVAEIHDKTIVFTDIAQKELNILEDAVSEITEIAIDAFVRNDTEAALKVEPLEEVIDGICDDMKSHHIDRVSRQECTLENGFVFNDLIVDYERIADHFSNVALDILQAGEADILSHEYHKKMDYRQNEIFQSFLQEYQEKYLLPLETE